MLRAAVGANRDNATAVGSVRLKAQAMNNYFSTFTGRMRRSKARKRCPRALKRRICEGCSRASSTAANVGSPLDAAYSIGGFQHLRHRQRREHNAVDIQDKAL